MIRFRNDKILENKLMKKDEKIGIGRRDLLKAGVAGVILYNTPSIAHANLTDHWNIISRLSPQRIISGFVFEAVSVIVVEIVKDAIYYLRNHDFSNLKMNASVNSVIRNDNHYYNFEDYKASVAMLGEADYRIYQKNRINRIKLMLNDVRDEQRFSLLVQYLRDNKIYIKTKNSEVSFLVGRDTEPDDLLSIEYFRKPGVRDMSRHYKEIEEITKTKIFKRMVG